MNKLANLSSKAWFQLIVFTCLTVVTYFSVLRAPKTVSSDAFLIIVSLDSVSGIWDYLKGLVALNMMDFQPVRDLSLALDWQIYKKYHFNTFVIQNAIVWIFCCFFTLKLLFRVRPELDRRIGFLLVCAFCVYPLFVQPITWTMIRKHLLAHFFIVLATDAFLSYVDAKSRWDAVRLNLFFALAWLSQPICLLWPVWAWTWTCVKRPNDVKSFFPGLLPLSAIAVVGIVVNWLYYTKSPFYSSYFFSKLQMEQLAIIPYAIGFYFQELFLPYHQTELHLLSLKHLVLGISFFSLLTFAYFWLKLNRKDLCLWLLFLFLPISVVAINPLITLDSYLLMPALGLLMLIANLLQKAPPKITAFLILCLIPAWSMYSAYEASYRTDLLAFSTKNFTSVPDCSTASALAAAYHLHEKPMPPGLLDFYSKAKCMEKMTHRLTSWRNLVGTDVYLSSKVKVDDKVMLFKDFAKDEPYALILLSATLIQKRSYEEAKLAIRSYVQYMSRIPSAAALHNPIVSKVILPFCERIGDWQCVRALSIYEVYKDTPFW